MSLSDYAFMQHGCCASVEGLQDRSVVFVGDSLINQLHGHFCSRADSVHLPPNMTCRACPGVCMLYHSGARIAAQPTAAQVIAAIAYRTTPSMIVHDYNGLHLLHMHPFSKPCCRPWLDTRVPQRMMPGCWTLLAGDEERGKAKDLQTQTYCADFWGWVTLEDRVAADAFTFRQRWPSTRLVLMSPHSVCDRAYMGDYRGWVNAPSWKRNGACASWVRSRLTSLTNSSALQLCEQSAITAAGSAHLAGRVRAAAKRVGADLLDAHVLTRGRCKDTKDGRHYPTLVPQEAKLVENMLRRS